MSLTIKLVNRFILIVIVFISACSTEDSDTSKQDNKRPQEIERVIPPLFNSDSAYNFIEKQVEFGPRVPNTLAHEQCADFLVSKLNSYGLKVEVQEAKVIAFDNSQLKIKNIIGSFKPELSNRILLTAHWDSRPFADQDNQNKNQAILGANDGASGVGVLLEIARILTLQETALGIDIIFFDAEDYGQPEGSMMERKSDTYCLGSQYWAKNMHVSNYYPRFGILLDMVGAEGATFTKEGTSMHFAPTIVDKVWNTAHKIGYSAYFINRVTDGITDDHLYINAIAGIPTIDIIHYDENTPSHFGSYWHTHDDNMGVIHKETLKAVGQTLLEVIFNEQ